MIYINWEMIFGSQSINYSHENEMNAKRTVFFFVTSLLSRVCARIVSSLYSASSACQFTGMGKHWKPCETFDRCSGSSEKKKSTLIDDDAISFKINYNLRPENTEQSWNLEQIRCVPEPSRTRFVCECDNWNENCFATDKTGLSSSRNLQHTEKCFQSILI